MNYTTEHATKTYRAIHSYYEFPTCINKQILDQHINKLRAPDLQATNEMGETLLLHTLKFNLIDEELSAKVVEALLGQARSQNDAITWRLNLTKSCYYGLTPLQVILENDSLKNLGHISLCNSNGKVGKVFFESLWAYIKKIKLKAAESLHLLSVNMNSLELAFRCKHQFIGQAYLNCIHFLISRDRSNHVLMAYLNLFFSPICRYFTIFDRLILGTLESMVLFFQELQYCRQNDWLSFNEHVQILTSHISYMDGFSPLHELVRTNNFEKINCYINCIRDLLPNAYFKEVLLKRNKANFTVINQGINNGSKEIAASTKIAKLFLDLLVDRRLFSVTECEQIIDGRGVVVKPLHCANYKENSWIINRWIIEIKHQLTIERQRYPSMYYYSWRNAVANNFLFFGTNDSQQASVQDVVQRQGLK